MTDLPMSPFPLTEHPIENIVAAPHAGQTVRPEAPKQPAVLHLPVSTQELIRNPSSTSVSEYPFADIGITSVTGTKTTGLIDLIGPAGTLHRRFPAIIRRAHSTSSCSTRR